MVFRLQKDVHGGRQAKIIQQGVEAYAWSVFFYSIPGEHMLFSLSRLHILMVVVQAGTSSTQVIEVRLRFSPSIHP